MPPTIAPSVPFDGCVTAESVSGSPSGSEHTSGTWTAVSTAVRTDASSQLGGRVIVIETVAGAPSPWPSSAV